MTTIDNRVVAMKFDNAQFEKGIKTTITSLGSLDKSLQLDGVGKGIAGIAAKFSALQIAGYTVISELTKGMMRLASKTIGAIAGPLIEGGKKRALSIEQAKFQFKGLGMDVEATMASALEAVKGTAYGLDEAATAAAIFGASGMRAGTEMTAALRGIAGVAAMSGSGFADIADVFTKVSGQGRLMGDDLNRLATRGVNAAATLGKALGKSEAEVRDMVTKGKIDFKTFAAVMNDTFGEHATKASETYSGSLANLRAAFARIGARHFAHQFEALRVVFNALTPVIDGISASLGYLGHAPLGFTDMFGKQMMDAAEAVATFLGSLKFDQAWIIMKPITKGFENLFKVVRTVLPPIAKAFREVFPAKTIRDFENYARVWRDFTKKLIPSKEGVKKIGIVFKGLFSILSLVGKVLGFVLGVMSSFAQVLFSSNSALGKLGSGFGDLLIKFFEFFTALNETVESTRPFEAALLRLHVWLVKSSIRFNKFTSILKDFARDMVVVKDKFKPVSEALARFKELVGSASKPTKDTTDNLVKMAEGSEKLVGVLSKVSGVMANVASSIIDALGPAVKYIKESIMSMSFDQVIKVLQTALMGGVFFKLSQFFKNFIGLGDKGINVISGFMGNLFKGTRFLDDISGILNGVTGALKGMQNNLNAQALKNIAISVAILAVSMMLISLIKPDRLKGAMVAISLLLTEVMLILFTFSKISGGGMVGINQAAIALILIGVALIILAAAVDRLGKMDPEALGRGLLAIGLLLTSLGIFTKLVSVNKGMVGIGAGFILFAIGLLIMSKAIGIIGAMDTGNILTAMATIGALFAFVAIVSRTIKPSQIAAVAVNMVLLSFGIVIMAGALKLLATMTLEEIGKGLLAMAGGLVLMVAAMNLIPDGAISKAVGLIIVAQAIVLLAGALAILGSMSWEALLASLIGLGAALGIIAIFLNVASSPSVLVGALALVIVSSALVLLAGALKAIGGMSVKAIAKGLIAIAAAFVIIGIAGYLLTGALPGLLGLGAALLLIGVAVFLAGVGIGLFAAGIGILAASLATGGAVMLAFIVGFAKVLPIIAASLAEALGAFARGLIGQQAAITDALISMFESVLDAIITIVPKILGFFSSLITGILDLLVEKIPEIVSAMMQLLIGILTAIEEFMPQLVEKAGDLAVTFIESLGDYYDKIATAGADFIIKIIQGIGKNMLKIANAAMDTVIKFIDGLTTAINANGAKFDTAVNGLIDAIFTRAKNLVTTGKYSFGKIAGHIIDGLKEGIMDGIDKVVGAITSVISLAYDAAKAAGWIKSPSRLFLRIGVWITKGLANGIVDTTSVATKAASQVVKDTYSAMQLASDAANDIFMGIEDPTITPVVDLDAVYAGANAISSLMGNAAAVGLSGSVNARMNQSTTTPAPNATDVTGNKTEVNLTQNNYSPKALSRLEIYRQTRNQLHTLKGVGG